MIKDVWCAHTRKRLTGDGRFTPRPWLVQVWDKWVYEMNPEWFLDVSYMLSLSFATVVVANYISETVKVFHIVIQNL